MWPSTTEWSTRRGDLNSQFIAISKILYTFSCKNDYSHDYFHQRLQHVDKRYAQNNFAGIWALKVCNVCANLWANKKADVPYHTSSSIYSFEMCLLWFWLVWWTFTCRKNMIKNEKCWLPVIIFFDYSKLIFPQSATFSHDGIQIVKYWVSQKKYRAADYQYFKHGNTCTHYCNSFRHYTTFV